MGLLDTSYGTVSANKPKKSDRILPRENMNIRGLLDAATAIPFAGDLLSGGLAAYDAAKGDYGSAAMNALSVLPILSAGMVKKAGNVADAVNAPKLTEFEQRHLVAQRNAALPVEQGGLGLPPNNTAMDRAMAMNFEDSYHGTRSDIQQIDKSRLGEATKARSAEEAFFSAAEPVTAGSYAMNLPDSYFSKAASKAEKYFNRSRTDTLIEQQQLQSLIRDAESVKPAWSSSPDSPYAKWLEEYKPVFDRQRAIGEQLSQDWEKFFKTNIQPMRDKAWDEGSNIMPLMVRTDGFEVRDFPFGYRDKSYFEVIKDAKAQGKPGVKLTNTTDAVGLGENAPTTDIYATIDPSRIRSRFAAFDPMRRHEADLLGHADPRLLGAMAGGGLLGLGGYSLMGDK